MIKKIQLKIKNQVIKYLKKYLIFFFNKDDQTLYNKNINIDEFNSLPESLKVEVFPETIIKLSQKCLEGNNPKDYYSVIKYLQLSKVKWQKKSNINFIDTIFLPPQQIIGSLGNYYPLFFFLFFHYLNGNNKKPTILLSENNKITNNYLFSFFEDYLNLVRKDSYQFYFNNIQNNLKIPLETLLPIDNKYYPWDFAVNIFYQKKHRSHNFKYFSLSADEITKGFEILKSTGLDTSRKFIVIHIREDGYNNNFSDNHSVRNSDPTSYIKAIKFILSKGINVIRVGDKSMKKLPKLDGFLDYAHSKIKSDFMDVFLAAKCIFCIGTSSGYYHIPMFFDRPILLLNCVPLAPVLSLTDKSMFLSKKYIYTNSKKKVNLIELFTFNKMMLGDLKSLKENNITVLDNSAEDVLSATKDMMEMYNKNIKNDFLQNNNIFKKKIHAIFQNNGLKYLKILTNFPNFFIKENLND